MRIMLFIVLIVIILLATFSIWENNDFENKNDSDKKEFGKIDLYFCPQDDCEQVLLDFLDKAQESIYCALFEVGLESIKNKLLEKEKEIEVKVVTDDTYLKKMDYPFVQADSWGLMHNKYCVTDGQKVATGSMNPTYNGVNKNNNNLLLIESYLLAKNYQNEFQEMWAGKFKSGERVKNPVVRINNMTIENYFCPEDNCAYHIKEELKRAEQSIYFLTFSFTHEGIANILLLKHLAGIPIKGVMENRQINKYSQFSRLEYQGIDVVKDGNPQSMHHKVFIIDGKTVITGSFNPTSGGDSKNDENILIIRDKETAKLFLQEFARVYDQRNSENNVTGNDN